MEEEKVGRKWPITPRETKRGKPKAEDGRDKR